MKNRALVKSSSLAALSFVLFALSGCATPPAPEIERAEDPAAVRIDGLLQKAAGKKTVGPEIAVPKPVYTWESSTVSYLGDAKNLLEDVAKSLGLQFSVGGPQPRLPIYVQVHAQALPLKALLEDVAIQMSQRADVVVTDGRIELRYRGL